MNRRLLLAALAWVVAACSDGAPEGPPEASVRDSAGVRIVTHAPVARPVLALDGSALLRAGVDDTLTLYQVRDGALREDGSVVLADSGNRRILVLGADGSVVRSLGTEGQGPGEFRQVAWLHLGTDGTIRAWDAGARRLTVFDAQGAVVGSRTFRPPRPEFPSEDALVTNGSLLGVLDDGRAIGYSGAAAVPTGEPGILPVRLELELYDAELAPADSLGRVVMIEWAENPSGTGGRPFGTLMEPARLRWDGKGDRFAYTSGRSHRATVIDDGAVTMIVEEDRARVPFRPDSVPEGYTLVADSLPSYHDLRVDADGRIWLRAAAHDPDPTVAWRVFEGDGTARGVLPLPADATVLDARGNAVLLLRRDELGREYVEVRRMGEAGG